MPIQPSTAIFMVFLSHERYKPVTWNALMRGIAKRSIRVVAAATSHDVAR